MKNSAVLTTVTFQWSAKKMDEQLHAAMVLFQIALSIVQEDDFGPLSEAFVIIPHHVMPLSCL